MRLAPGGCIITAWAAIQPPLTPRIPPVFDYSDSVLEAADDDGNLSRADAVRLLADHSMTLNDVYADNHGVSWVALDTRNAEALLAWLGY